MSERVGDDLGEVGADDRAARARAVFAGIGAEARRSNQHRAGELASALDALGHGGLLADDRLRATDVAHQLVGSAGTFGYPRASALAREVELFLADEGEPEPAQLAAAVRSLVLIEQDLALEPDWS